MVNKLFLFILLSVHVKCTAQYCGICPERKSNYRLRIEKNQIDSDRINLSFENIYLFSQAENKAGAIGNYLILSPEGGAYVSCPLCLVPSGSLICDRSSGYFGSYTIKNGTIKITLFSRWARYYYIYGQVSSEGILITHDKQRGGLVGKKSIPHKFYRKSDIKFDCEFDWID